MNSRIFWRLALAVFLHGAQLISQAHEGQDHAHDPAPQVADQTRLPRAAANSSSFELVAVLEPARLLVYVDASDTNAPVLAATVEVQGLNTPTDVSQPVPEVAPGVYALALLKPVPPGSWPLVFSVQTADDGDLLSARLENPAPAVAGTAASALTAWLWGLAAALLGVLVVGGVWAVRRGPRKNAPPSNPLLALMPWALMLWASSGGVWAHEGKDHGESNAKFLAGDASREASVRRPDGSLFVPKAVQRQLQLRTQRVSWGEVHGSVELHGRVAADPAAGGRVQATQAGTVLPAGKAFPVLGQVVRKGQIVARLRPVASALERGDRLAQQADVAAQLALAERRVVRLTQLEGSVPTKELESARVERQALQQRHAALKNSLNAEQALVAPVSGVISQVAVVAGEVVDAKTILFEVVDPTRLTVEAIAYDMGLPAQVHAATAMVGTSAIKLVFAGAGRLLHEQGLPLRFRVTQSDAVLSVGQSVRVLVQTRVLAPGGAVPLSAVVRDASGQSVVWLHREAEHFEPRRIRHEALDAHTVVVREGLKGGERVVVQGAGLLAQIR